MEIRTNPDRQTFYRLSDTDHWTAITVEVARQCSIGDATVTAAGWVADSSSGNGKRDEILLATERDGRRSLYWRPPYGGGGWMMRTGTWTPEELAGMLPVEAALRPSLLLMDGEGWAGLYGPDDAERLARHLQGAEQAGEVPYVSAYLLVPGCPEPVRASAHGSRSEWDDDLYADQRVSFRPVEQPKFAGIHEEYTASWRVDGRA